MTLQKKQPWDIGWSTECK